jgi:hypothetical protein
MMMPGMPGLRAGVDVHPGSGVHVGGNPAARAAANEHVRIFLRDRLQGAPTTAN